MKLLFNCSAVFLFFAVTSCVSTRLTIQNIDDNAPTPTLTKDNCFLVTEYTNDPKYGYDPDYPINVFYKNSKDENLNAHRFLRALAGPKGETITFTKVESCCPFPSKRTDIGAGFLDVYELTWENQKKPIRLYLNIYEKGLLKIPVGLRQKT